MSYPTSVPEPIHRSLPIFIHTPARSIENIDTRSSCIEKLNCNCELVSSPPLNQDSCIILFDCQELSPEQIQYWLEKIDTHCPDYLCGLVNTDHQGRYESLVQWPAIKAVFYRNCSPNDLIDGLLTILSGELWLSRRLFTLLMNQYRYTPSASNDTIAAALTRREKQILKCVHRGLSNEGIAQRLFVSEHTIKSHLYSAYKKLGVSSRLEASNWVRDYLLRQQQWNW